MRIANNVEMLKVYNIESTVYLVLVWDADHLVLIDAGYPGQRDAIVKAIADAGFSAERLTHIILTHQDYDHIGCVLELLELSPSAQILAHIDEAPYIDGRKTPIKLAEMLDQYDNLSDDQKMWCDNYKEEYATQKIIISQMLSDGDTLPICGGIEVVHTPGHTPGHICILLQECGVMVTGDALNIEDGEMIGPIPQYTHDMELALRSAEKAKSRPFNAIIAYHGGYLKI